MYNYPLEAFVKGVQKVFNVEATGIAGPETLLETLTISEVLNPKHPAVYYIQLRLYTLGYTEVGKVNGVANSKFTAAVKHFQADNACVIDGEITARAKTWKKLLGME